MLCFGQVIDSMVFCTWICVQATFECLLKTYGFLTPDLWRETRFSKSPFQEFTDFLAKPHKISVLEDVEKTPVY